MKTTIRVWLVLSACLGLVAETIAATPPGLANYQGVLRDASGRPLTGTYSMVIRFYDAEAGGNEILVDSHPAVTVSAGLFNVVLGGGTVTDGSGPNSYGFLPKVFGDYTVVYLELAINGEILAPRTRMLSAAYAMNAKYVNGYEVATAGPLDLYVNGATGDDANSGLSPSAAKRTIQGAVDRIPAIAGGDVTVHIADGTYAEQVLLADKTGPKGNRVTLLGNSANPAAVRITGSGVRGQALVVRNVSLAALAGMSFEEAAGANGSGTGVQIWKSQGDISDCRFVNNDNFGLWGREGFVEIRRSVFSGNRSGLGADQAGMLLLSDASVTGNSDNGLAAEMGGRIEVSGPITVTGNGAAGCRTDSGGFINFNMVPDAVVQSNNGGACQLNSRLNGIILGFQNAAISSPQCCVSGNGQCFPDAY